MAGRPREFDVIAAREVAMQLFWTQGYEATPLSELLPAMGLSKSSFYQTYESKHVLFEQCLVRYGDILVNAMKEGLADAPCAIVFIRAALIQISNETSDPIGRRGCLMMNTASEFSQRDQKFALIVRTGIQAMAAVFTEAVVAAQAAGDIKTKARPEALADYLVTAIIGLKTQVKAGASSKQIMSIAELTVTALEHMD